MQEPVDQARYQKRFIDEDWDVTLKKLSEGEYFSMKDYNKCVAHKLTPITTDQDGKKKKIIKFLEEMQDKNIMKVYNHVPNLYINHELVRGATNGLVAASAVCDSFKVVPKSCTNLHVNVTKPIDTQYSNVHFLRSLVLFILACLAFFGCVFFIYKKVMVGQVDKDMNEMVNYHLERYQSANTSR